MGNLYALSQAIRSTALYRSQRDSIQYLYFQLGIKKQLTAENVFRSLCQYSTEWKEALLSSALQNEKKEREIESLVALGYRFVNLGEADYPKTLYAMEEPPLCLSFLGEPLWKDQSCLSVVGSREPSFESLQWMEKELAVLFENQSMGIVSGGARGVDQKVHALAIRYKRPTCVVLPSGLGNVYPANLQPWTDAILKGGGCLLSEYSHDMQMQKYLFPHRNRLIAALGLSTLIIEARHRSGTLITAEQACEAGRPVWVLPGHPQDSQFSGSLQLIMEGATMIRHAEDLRTLLAVEIHSFQRSTAGMGVLTNSNTTGSEMKKSLLNHEKSEII